MDVESVRQVTVERDGKIPVPDGLQGVDRVEWRETLGDVLMVFDAADARDVAELEASVDVTRVVDDGRYVRVPGAFRDRFDEGDPVFWLETADHWDLLDEDTFLTLLGSAEDVEG